MNIQLKIKVVLNKCYGGFGLSLVALKRYQELKGKPCYFGKWGKRNKVVPAPIEEANQWIGAFEDEELTKPVRYYDFDRSDPILVQVVEELGKKASGECSKLVVEEVYFDVPVVNSFIEEYDGYESWND